MRIHLAPWRPFALLTVAIVLAVGFTVSDTMTAGGSDSYSVFAKRFLLTPALAAVGACVMAWLSATLRSQGYWTRTTNRSVLLRISVPSATFTLVQLAAILVSVAIMMTARRAWGPVDLPLVPVYGAMLFATSAWSIALGLWLPRLIASITALASTFFILFMPQTLTVAWPRSVVGLATAPSSYYIPAPEIYAGTTLWAAAATALAFTAVLYHLRRNEPGAQNQRTLAVGSLVALLLGGGAVASVRNLNFQPMYDRGLPIVCTGGHPNWCVLEKYQRNIPYLQRFDAAIIATEKETGVPWVNLTERSPEGLIATVTENNKRGLVTVYMDGTLPLAAERVFDGIYGTAYPCPNVPPYTQGQAAYTYAQWWKYHLYPKVGLPTDGMLTYDSFTPELLSWPLERQRTWLKSVLDTNKQCTNMPPLPLNPL
ncbi:hypothetical protein JT358_08095 [Micrococcales bacterium 31B]|nr:hypothetical protein [Micrococcales bacterium 31B]